MEVQYFYILVLFLYCDISTTARRGEREGKGGKKEREGRRRKGGKKKKKRRRIKKEIKEEEEAGMGYNEGRSTYNLFRKFPFSFSYIYCLFSFFLD
jgi:hypothetical protein